MGFASAAAIVAMAFQTAPIATDPPARAATSDECAVALETLRQFRDIPAGVLVQARLGHVVMLDHCPGGGRLTDEQPRPLSIDVDTERGVATAVYGRCQDWYVSLTRRDGSWFAAPANQVQDACGELAAPPQARDR
ncbi:hypothetical protein DMC25_09205 [Caulobacter sp. D4A]|uniref:hypothetical protein n=1 Tax=unclassified Caulobacter TaxID=2648921 RepID=UPI000D73ECA9|nr:MULTISPECIES: hypothetical protein [unclassified Caulobacter]PXA89639.1 hypothetical protein DMC25_09205 [Caulobacter sp. D4A]PXA93848.1 hypothetical protein DMC18_07830 [Caulobacter sp. D5]